MIGKRISHYQILKKLGEGGMGVVYKAQDTRLDRTVALKFLPPHMGADTDANERFVHEAKAASALDHPNICTIHDIGQDDEGKLFIVMAYYEGQTLKYRLQEGTLSIDQCVDIAAQTAEGLARAHEAGIVHRDIKPDNIMVIPASTEAGRNRVKVLDFGVAKLGEGMEMTNAGSTVGTAAYMSPEQARGEPVDHRADVWSLGVVLYEMLAGQRPFEGSYEAAVIYSILNAEPEPLASLRPDVPEGLVGIVERAMAKEAEARYTTMSAMLEDLRALQAPAVQTAPFSLVALFRRPQVAVPLGIVLLAVIALSAWQVQRGEKVRWARQVALPEIQRLTDNGLWREPFDLAVEAEKYIPEDSMLARLWPYFSRHLKIYSDPPGANVYRKAYSPEDTAWTYLGETPIDSVRTYFGFDQWKFEKSGYVATLLVSGSGGMNGREVKLFDTASLPKGMRPVSGGSPEVYLPGLEHLERKPVQNFLMDTYEVTHAEYKAFIEQGGYENRTYWQQPFVEDGQALSWEEAMARFTDRTGQPGPATWEVGDYPEGEADHPVRGISWYEAVAYAVFAEKHLPTVYHWNLAASTPLSSYIVPLSNFNKQGPAAKGQYRGMSSSGLYDMAGNVREWVWNETDRNGQQRFILGGSWNGDTWTFNDARFRPPFDRSPENGFRCIQYLEPNENQTQLERMIELPFRDFLTAEPISDETFDIFLRQFDYDKTPLQARIEAQDSSHGDWTREQITFDAAYGDERVTAYLYLPKQGTPPYQTVAYFPGSFALHSRIFERGNEFSVLNFFVKSGRAVLYPVYKSTYERGDGMLSDMQNATIDYKDHVIMWSKDLSRSIDYLETRDDIDMNKLAYVGSSWGGVVAPMMLVAEPRLKVGILRGAGLEFQTTLPETDPFNYLPRVTVPMLIMNGRYDYFFPVETTLMPYFNNLGTPTEDRALRLYDSGHAVPRVELIKESLAWLDRYFGPVEHR